MRASPLAAATCLAGAGALVLPPLARGYDEIGFELGVVHRDFRIHNNFDDEQANDNLVIEPAFPGWFGADQSIWKASAEWGSELRAGTGEGDPSQSFDLGSGAANFDFFFSGRNDSNGVPGDDTHGELKGCAGGIHAFTEFLLDGTGFRTRYYSCWLWVDDPEGDWQGGTGWLDLQGIATHELGHALGLGHSEMTDATMYANTTDGKSHRSLHADDVAGIQAIYGVRSGAKPRITGVTVNGSSVVLTGTGFAAADNELWFTADAAVAGADPVILSGVSSSGAGTTITVSAPDGAGSGEVLVRVGGTGGERVSNAWPLDLGSCPPPVPYCVAAPNSAGPGAMIATEGSRSITVDDFSLFAVGSIPDQFGLFFYAAGQDQIPAGNGFLCLAPPFFRLPAQMANGQGRADLMIEFDSTSGAGEITAGSTWNFQWWYRDPAGGGAMYNFSDAVEVTFCP